MTKNLIKNIYARNSEVAIVSEKDARYFLKPHHKQSSMEFTMSVKCIGLYTEGELVAVAAFGPLVRPL